MSNKKGFDSLKILSQGGWTIYRYYRKNVLFRKNIEKIRKTFKIFIIL